jgi:hypothetical protein
VQGFACPCVFFLTFAGVLIYSVKYLEKRVMDVFVLMLAGVFAYNVKYLEKRVMSAVFWQITQLK